MQTKPQVDRIEQKLTEQNSKDGKISDFTKIFLKYDITLEIFIKNLIENIFIAIDKPKVAKVTESDDEDVFGDEGEDEFDESASETDDLITTVSQAAIINESDSVNNLISSVRTNCSCTSACKTKRCPCKNANLQCNLNCHNNNSM